MENWEERSKKSKIKFILKSLFWFFAIGFVVVAVFSKEIFGGSSIFDGIFTGEEGGLEFLLEFLKNQVSRIVELLVYISVVILISRIARSFMKKALLKTRRGRTTSKLIDSFLNYLTAIIIALIVLVVFGVNPVALLASVGVLGLVIGLGAQSLISDIISGLFIVFEGDYEVGDYVIIDGFRGKVESIGIRTTQIVNGSGNIKIINNSEIKTVVNLSYDLSSVNVDVKVIHDDFLKAEKVIHENIKKLKEVLNNFSSGPEYVGPSDITNDGVFLRFTAKVPEEKIYQAERDLRRAIIILFDENNIETSQPKVFIQQNNEQ